VTLKKTSRELRSMSNSLASLADEVDEVVTQFEQELMG